MLMRVNNQRFLLGMTVLFVGVLSVTLVTVTPVSAQTMDFVGSYEMTMYLPEMELTGEMDVYNYIDNGSLQTFFGTYSPFRVTHRPDYRLNTPNDGLDGYIGISDQNSYANADGDLVKSETTYSIRLDGYQQVTYTSTYEYGNYNTITNNATLFEETYTERYYEDGDFIESAEYHEYTFLLMDDGAVRLTNETVDAGEFECIVLDTYTFLGIDTDITVSEDWDYYQGGPMVWIDTNEGHMVIQRQYDEYNALIGELSLTSLVDPNPPLIGGGGIDSSLLLIGGSAGAVIIVGAVVMKMRSSPTPEYRPSDVYEY
jgi:hypothetical protein